jgi:hypothetical protein
MKKRMTATTTAVVCVLLLALALSVAACGGGSTTTTGAATTATTAAATSTTATSAPVTATSAGTSDTGATATTAGSVTVPSIQMTADVTAYLQQMQTVFGSMQSLPDAANPLKITDVSTVTDAQIKSFEQTVAQMKSSLDGLSKITPPAGLATFQRTLATALQGLYDAATKAVQALKSKDQAAFDAAKAESDKVTTQMQSVLESLVPLMMGTTATS